jgi:amino acid adenylation domain-containing protein
MPVRLEPAPRETYDRPISPNEWPALCHIRGIITEVQLCVEGNGVIDPAALSAAVAVASEACPGARLVRRGRRWVDSGTAPVVRVAEAADFDRTRLDSPLLRTHLTGDRSPTCEVVLVRGAPTTVIFRACHAAMDGGGVMWWQRQVFRALRGEAVEEATSRLTCADVRAAIAERLGHELPPVVPPSGPGQPQRSLLGKLPRGPRRSMWRRRTIDGIHPGVTAKVARLIAAYGDGDKGGLIEIPVDMRQLLPGLRTTGGASSHITVQVHGDEDWTDVHAHLLAAMSEHRYLAYRNDPCTLDLPVSVMTVMARWGDDLARKNDDVIAERGWRNCMATVSHLGAVDLDDFCADGFEATSFYSLGSVAYTAQVNVVECRGRTEVTLAWRGGPGVGERAEALLDWIEEGLSPRSHRDWDGNRTGRPAPAGPATLTALFAAQAARTPAAIAISGPDRDITYAQLSRHAAAVTAALAARGAGRGDRIGLVAGRTPAAIAAIWGILAAGAAYLPIDPAYPAARITGLLTDAGAPACLLEHPAAPGLLPPGCQPIPLDALPPAPPSAAAPAEVWPGDLACVIYTSGSTGTPKGVEIEHRALVNYVRWATREARIDAATRMPLIASLSFDMAGCAIYLPLLAGGTVLPVPEVNAATLREAIEDRGATAIALTPSHLDLINQAGITRTSMRVIMTAGELLRRSTALRAREIFGPQCTILCQWGPTETTIVNTSHTFNPATDTSPGVPFGRPMDNNTVHLLDPRGRHVPPGEPGEACVGGIQLARGYLGRPDLTRQRFTQLADGTRLYRTGDIARLLPTGDLAFLSRADDQVKIAGHRIEPAEITQALETHPGVRHAAVIPRTRPGRHDKELCAYIVADPGLAPGDLKEFLAGQLPRYMIPAAIIAVPEIPRTPNGKTDTRHLPDPFTPTPADQTPTPDRDHVTNAVASIWAQTLQVDPGQLDDQADFHQLGGNSMLLLTMIDEVSRTVVEHGQEDFMTELRQIIRKPTLGQVSDLARQARNSHPVRPEAQTLAGL